MRFLAGFVIGIVVVLAGAYLFLTQGGMPVATRGQPLPLERFLASRALHVAMAKDAGRPSPLPANEANLLAGAPRRDARDAQGGRGRAGVGGEPPMPGDE